MTLEPGSTVAVIPALNEAASIARVVRGVAQYATVVVVDDGSTDGTGELARRAGAHVVRHATNLGYDAALASGIEKACAIGAAYAITLDADGQHNPGLVGAFIDEFSRGADLVVGVRNRHQRVAESVFAVVGTMLWGLRDPLCGMKGYRLAKFANAGRFNRYKSIGTSFAIAAAKSGYNVVQIPIHTERRIGKPRFGSGLRANAIILKALLLGIVITHAIGK